MPLYSVTTDIPIISTDISEGYMPKNLVVCCDGTNNEIAGDATNVLRLYRMLVRDSEQVAYYDSGVGTIANPDRITSWGRSVSKLFDSAMGLSIRHHFLKAYRFLAQHYEPGDRIYLFGFSRGAYTARAVAGAIRMFGLLRPELEGLEDLVWAIYSGENNLPASLFSAAPVFKKVFGNEGAQTEQDSNRYSVKIHCVCVWDTVSAFGTISDQRTLPYTSDNTDIKHVRHAVSIDERRSIFQANLFRPKDRKQHDSFKQVWFAGVHSDVGGGYPEATGTLSKVSLNWMLDEVSQLELKIDPKQRTHLMSNPAAKHPPADPLGTIHESLEKGWQLLEVIPQRRYQSAKDGLAWQRPNLWHHRPVVEFDGEGQPMKPTLHQSVLDRKNNPASKYSPTNLPPEGEYLVEP